MQNRTAKRSLMGRIHRAYRAFFQPCLREILPLSSGTPVEPGKTISITGRVQSAGFWPDQLTISNAGTKGGAADWIVNDIKIANRSQFSQSGDVPGDVFATNAAQSFVQFEVARPAMNVELVATYIGTNETGCPLFAAMSGMEYDPGLLDTVREAISQALSSASRGLSTRPQ